MNKNIVLIGYMGTGKTEVGNALAKKLGMKYMDTDSMIESESGRSISDIFKVNGEECFRDMETKLLKKLSGTSRAVISTGGGMVLRAENVKMLKNLGSVVLLHSRPEVIETRIDGSKSRPLLDTDDRGAKIREMLKVRGPIYQGAADISLDTSDLPPSDIADVIIGFYKGE